MIVESYRDYMKGKRVALVVSGASLFEKGLGDLIESYDVVVRLNRALPVDPRGESDVGKRTDVLYNTLDGFSDAGGPIDGDLWKRSGVKYVCSTYPKSEYFTYPEKSSHLNNILPTRWMKDEVYYPIREYVKFRPNSGTTTLMDILSHDIGKVHLFGLDFFRTLYDPRYLQSGGSKEEFERHLATNKRDRHDPDSQYKFFKHEVYPNDDRIVIDEYFKEILKNPKYDKMYFL
tara:strand:- start:1018 stop:1713 length:696 start_codon:yes stop_codon:yes gene_type:complete